MFQTGLGKEKQRSDLGFKPMGFAIPSNRTARALRKRLTQRAASARVADLAWGASILSPLLCFPSGSVAQQDVIDAVQLACTWHGMADDDDAHDPGTGMMALNPCSSNPPSR